MVYYLPLTFTCSVHPSSRETGHLGNHKAVGESLCDMIGGPLQEEAQTAANLSPCGNTAGRNQKNIFPLKVLSSSVNYFP